MTEQEKKQKKAELIRDIFKELMTDKKPQKD